MEAITKLLSKEEIILPGSSLYEDECKTWDAHKNLHPQVIARPGSLESLSRLIVFLCNSELDFTIRSSGTGSASARDVLVSMAAFDGFEWDASSETITIGTGQTWGEVDRKMEEADPDYAAMSARCTYVGVGGSVLAGGISWQSSERGLISDPQNLLDAQVVKTDGTVIWASKEPDLFWALRGGGGGFGVVTAFKIRAYKYTNKIYAGIVMYPRESLPQVAKKVTAFVRENNDPKMALHFYCLNLTHGDPLQDKPVPGIAVMVYDGHGEEHGRSEVGFKWALDIEGAVDTTSAITYRQANQLADSLKSIKGRINTYYAGATIPTIDEGLIFRAWEWYDNLIEREPKLSPGTLVLIEIVQKNAFSSIESPTDCAWPHTSHQHILQLGTGALPGSPELDKLALQALHDGPFQIAPGHSDADYFPNFTQPFNDPKAIFGQNYEKLVSLKQHYDPLGRLKGWFAQVPN